MSIIRISKRLLTIWRGPFLWIELSFQKYFHSNYSFQGFENNDTSRETRESYEEYKDDIDHLLEGDLTFYDEGADTAAGDVVITSETPVEKHKEVHFKNEPEEEEIGKEDDGGGEAEEGEYEEENGSDAEEEEESPEKVEPATSTITTEAQTTTTPEEVTQDVSDNIEDDEDAR